MTRAHRRSATTLLGAALLIAGCRDLSVSTFPLTLDESDLIFVRVDPEAPPLTALEVSFWAVQGQSREVQISYESTDYGNGKCLLFRVPADAVMEGVAQGDSVRITIRVLDAEEFRFEFVGDDVRFDPDHPAEVEIRYRWADPDYDRDGDVDPRDLYLSETFGLWQKLPAGTAWEQVPLAQKNRDILEIAAPVLRFTQYALATD